MRPPRRRPDTIPIEQVERRFAEHGLPPPITIEPDPYEAAVMAVADELAASGKKPLLRVFFNGEIIGEVFESDHGAFWASVYEFVATRDIHPVDERYVSMIIQDRRRWDRFGTDGMPRSLRAAMELLEWPERRPYPPRLRATGPSGGLHEFVIEDVLREVGLARSNHRSGRWDVDRRPRSTTSWPAAG